MKTKFSKRATSLVLTLGILLTLLPTTALAATKVTPVPSQKSDTKLNVEYLTSTLYSWDEAAANAATAEVDYVPAGSVVSGHPTISQVQSGGYYLDSGLNQEVSVVEGTSSVESYTRTSKTYSDICQTETSEKTPTEYFYSTNGTYYPVYYTHTTKTGWGITTHTYTLYYCKNDGSYEEIGSTEWGSKSVKLYTQDTSTTYWLEYPAGNRVEGNTTYPSTSSTVNKLLYYESTDGGYEGKGFYFTNADSLSVVKSSGAAIPAYSSWTGTKDSVGIAAQNYYIHSGLAASKLSESSNAPFSNDVNAAKLFATDGSNETYTDVYTGVKVPFVYDAETGYYELNSDKNAVYFEDGAGVINGTMLIADKPAAFYWENYYVTGFQPFNSLSGNSTTNAAVKSATKLNGSNANTSAYTVNSANYGFGMVTNVNFQMTDNGLDAKNNPITFEFSGDDDVWVYVDGFLVLDIGGTHDAIKGTINFATGAVTLSSSYGKVGDQAVDKELSGCNSLSGTLSQTNLYTALGDTLTGFAASGNHTLTIYYMDRGQGRTNCLIKFNLPQRDSYSVTKSITQSKDTNGNVSPLTADEQARIDGVAFGFTLYRDDTPVPNKTYYLTYTENGETKQTTPSTDANGHFTLKNGQTARFLGEISKTGTSLYVVEDALNPDAYTEPEYRYKTNISSDKVTVAAADGFTSMKLTAEGSDTAADSIEITCINYLNEELPNPSIQPADDLIVLDYGLPISISTEKLLANDTRRGDSFTLTEITSQGKYGTAALSEDGKTITYILNNQLDGIEELTYTAVAHSNAVGVSDSTGTGKVKIIPATSVYYEENFGPEGGKLVTTKTNTAEFTTVGKSLTGYQETGFVGTTTDSTYGTDAVYLNNLGDSYGTSLMVDTTNGAAQYSYSFTGTGTTIYGRVSNVTGYIRVTVKDSDGNTVETQYIDTINYVTVPDGETAQILDTTLYNIPIYQNTMLGSYGTYTVTIYVYKSGTLHDGNNEFYLDGIRVFNPMGTSTEDNAGYATANSAYSADGEQNVAVVNIREKIVADSENNQAISVFTLTDINGQIQEVADYGNIGPNQELYLKAGYSCSFALINWDSKSYKLYLGMKAPNGTASEVTVGSGTFDIGNSADCYYDISSYVVSETLGDGTVVGHVTITGKSGLTALTNLKVTGVEEFNLGYSKDIDAGNEDIVTEDEGTENPLYLVSRTFAAGLVEKAEEEIPVFTPDSFEINCSYSSLIKIATLNVVSSDDVAYVTINGVKVPGWNLFGKLVFAKSYTRVPAGTTYEIVAYNADGVASMTYTVTAK